MQRRRRKPKSIGWQWKLGLGLAGSAAALLIWAALARSFAPRSNTAGNRFDAIIVLGTPADSDGNPTPTQLARVTEAVNEYKRGVASHIILSGGSVRNQFVEARVMARSAQAQGIPSTAIVQETQATDTIENACDSLRIMHDHGWNSAEVVSSAWHLPRAGLIFNALPIQWTAHAAPQIAPESSAYESALASVEVLKTARYLIWSRWAERCGP
jgi:uncharacterized SAM-binding protein YcdF (DUF218 family)